MKVDKEENPLISWMEVAEIGYLSGASFEISKKLILYQNKLVW